MKNKIVFMIIVFLTALTLGGNKTMANYDIQMSQRNASNTEWDNHYPITKVENVLTENGTVASELANISVQMSAKVDKVTGKGLSTNDYNATEKAEVAKVVNKADKSYVDLEIASVSDGTPEAFETLTAIQSAYPTGSTYVKLNNADGYVYKWSGTAWVSGWVYQSTGISEASVKEKMLEDTYSYGEVGYNKFDKRNITSGKYVNLSGVLATNVNYYTTDYIPVTSDNYYVKTFTLMELYDTNKTFIRGANVGDAATIVVASGEVYMRLSGLLTSINTAMLNKGMRLSEYTTYKLVPKGQSTKTTFAVAKDGTGDFATIDGAVQAIPTGSTIIVYPGIYIEAVDAKLKEISIIGVNKRTCILKNQSTLRLEPPLELSAGYIANMTIYAEKLAGAVWDEGSADTKPYACHIDYDNSANKTLEFFNCDIKSDWNAACGIGLRGGSHLIFRDCDLTTNIYTGATGISAPLYFHESQNVSLVGNQYITVDNCNLKANADKVIIPYSLGNLNNFVYMTFKRTCAYSSTAGKTNLVDMWIFEGMGGDKFMGSNNFYLTADSFGNNIAEINY